jgi:hypothetical protein
MAVWKLVCEMLHKVSDVEGKVRLLRQVSCRTQDGLRWQQA